jgi:hypothetical protein
MSITLGMLMTANYIADVLSLNCTLYCAIAPHRQHCAVPTPGNRIPGHKCVCS